MSDFLTEFFATNANLLARLPSPWVDAGAYKGAFTDACLALKPDVTLEAFEPQPHRAAKLVKKYAACPNIRVHAKALGANPAGVPLHITKGNAFSSVLPPLETMQETHGDRARIIKIAKVEQVRLDSVLAVAPGFLKLDIQGAELEALQGCGALLANMHAILVELGENPRYRNQPNALCIHELLKSHGFSLKERWGHPSKGSPKVYDVLYVRDVT